MKTHWNEAEAIIAFDRIFASSDESDWKAGVRKLQELGLTDREIECGIIAGLVQMEIDEGRSFSKLTVFREYIKEHPNEARIVLRSIIF